ncbi:alpha-L-fucosidase 2 [Paenibacillus sp. UNCCL117]|uniref:glycoside hydrolase family 95 protein n=1 Tax=unclassified Paenibacillus TaxID=185978 RepID=UPI00087E901D|nr:MULTISPECIES: glycoside hydrolase family 95 protein [unclassified Paenibacillus]SDE20627.1 alpha-L-fucosidase 2 [Paenibacillus sp. cl123]SFW61663.1 alpha-L-fucosidase 2 [Paenibacillus sp. UNCCL117]
MDKRHADSSLWYKQPAAQWVEALPVGNGRIGGMIFGQPGDERIQLNEDSIWYGGPKAGENPDGRSCLPHIRELLLRGEAEEAAWLTRMAMYSQPKYYNPYQPLGELKLFFGGAANGQVEDYRRELDLSTGIVRISYTIHGLRYTREIFCSSPDQVLVIRLTCSEPGRLRLSASLNRRPYEGASGARDERTVGMSGECGRDGVDYVCLLRAVPEEGGTGTIRTVGDFISVEGASAVTLLLAAGSTFREADPEQVCLRQLNGAQERSYEELRSRHTADYRTLYDRVSLRLGPGSEAEADQLPTDERLKRVQEGAEDQGLTGLLFQYGRYLMIASSRPGTLPSTLQGIWNDSFTPPWESKYTININTQMNYWPAEVCGLSECHEPLFDHLERMREHGRRTARELYGCGGFVAHHNTNLWGETRPEGLFTTCVLWPMGAAWLSLHLWERYLFTRDESFLAERAYPVLKEAAEFFVDYLYELPDGRLVTGPSVSPENLYVLPDGGRAALCMGPSMDTQIVAELFGACIRSAELLGGDEAFAERLSGLRARLPQPQIGRHGQLMEWLEDYEEHDPGHRHISQLFALHPGTAISTRGTPELSEAARTTLRRRLSSGGGHTGWSCAWIINMFARLEDGEQAHAYVLNLLRKSIYPNLFDAHPPFQIDGNFGVTAGIAEMLLQSHQGELHLLPALPKAWSEGEISGLRARGGYEVSIAWSGGALREARLMAAKSGVCRVRVRGRLQVAAADERPVPASAGEDGQTLVFRVEGGQVYSLLPC